MMQFETLYSARAVKKLSTAPYQVLYFGYRNVHSLGAEILKEADEEKDLRFIINQSLKSSIQCVAVAAQKAANRTLDISNRTLNRHTEFLLKMWGQ